MLIQKVRWLEEIFQNAVEPFSLNMKEEKKMAEWIKTNTPTDDGKLWPEIE